MRKFGFAAVCCLAAAALVGCNKNAEKCSDSGCKDTAAVKMDAGTAPASDAKCCAGKDKAASKCCQSKKGM